MLITILFPIAKGGSNLNVQQLRNGLNKLRYILATDTFRNTESLGDSTLKISESQKVKKKSMIPCI